MSEEDTTGQFTSRQSEGVTAVRRHGLAVLCLLFALLNVSLAGHTLPTMAFGSSATSFAASAGNDMSGGDHPCKTGHVSSAEHCHMAAGCSVSMLDTACLAFFTKSASEHWPKPPVFHRGQAIDPHTRPPQASLLS